MQTLINNLYLISLSPLIYLGLILIYHFIENIFYQRRMLFEDYKQAYNDLNSPEDRDAASLLKFSYKCNARLRLKDKIRSELNQMGLRVILMTILAVISINLFNSRDENNKTIIQEKFHAINN
tara:strand:+ start:62 stop:430 length:369 start_codon:yes stop_codon:yes gene_type:complete